MTLFPMLLALMFPANAQATQAPTPAGAHGDHAHDGHEAPARPCTTPNQSLPDDMVGWTRTGERLVGGHAVNLIAVPDAHPEPGQRPGNVATIAFSVPMNGLYGIALDQGAWIDVQPVMDRGPARALTSVHHGRGPACSTIRKVVVFDLTAGTYYSLSVTGVQGTSARVMIVPPPPPAPPQPEPVPSRPPQPHGH